MAGFSRRSGVTASRASSAALAVSGAACSVSSSVTGQDGWQTNPPIYTPGDVSVGTIEFVAADQNVFVRDNNGGVAAAKQAIRTKQKPFDLFHFSAEHPKILPRPMYKDVSTAIRVQAPARTTVTLSTLLLEPDALHEHCNLVSPTKKSITLTMDEKGWAQAFYIAPREESPPDKPFTVQASHTWERNGVARMYVWPEAVKITVQLNRDIDRTKTPHWMERRWQQPNVPIILRWGGDADALAHKPAIVAAIRRWNNAQLKVVIEEEPVAVADSHIEFIWRKLTDNLNTPLNEATITSGVTFPQPVPSECPPLYRKPVAQYISLTKVVIDMRVGVDLPDNDAWLHWNLVHELGHALGLNHNMVDGGAVMASPHSREGRLTTPQPNDLSGFNEIYP